MDQDNILLKKDQRSHDLEAQLYQRDVDIIKHFETIAVHEVKIDRLSDITRRLLRHRFGPSNEKT